MPLRDHLEAVERQIGRKPKELDGPDFPELLAYVWSAFISLNSARTVGFNGPNPISYPDILAWKELTGNSISFWEIEAIKNLDAVYMRVSND